MQNSYQRVRQGLFGTGQDVDASLPSTQPQAQAANASRRPVANSLDYEPPHNKIYFDRLKEQQKDEKRHFYGYTGHTLARFVVTALTGLATGLVSLALTEITEPTIEWRKRMLKTIIRAHGPWCAFGAHCAYTVTLTTLTALAVQFFAPAAAGAGVHSVMAYLNGNDLPQLLRPHTLCVKFLGTAASVVSGLVVGLEAPMIHMGACVASVIAYWELGTRFKQLSHNVKRLFRKTSSSADEGLDDEQLLEPFHSDADHREFVSAGAAAGLASAFGAPIGGVLFSMEEACSHWNRRVAWRSFISASLAVFVVANVLDKSQTGLLGYEDIQLMSNTEWLKQLPLLVVVSMLGGCLGALFNFLRRSLWVFRPSRLRHGARIAEVMIIGVASVSVLFLLTAAVGSCLTPPQAGAKSGGGWDEEYLVPFTCPEGQYNDLATLYFNPTLVTIRHLFSLGNSELQGLQACLENQVACTFTAKSLITMAISYVFLMALASGIAVPGGIFLPGIVAGASMGASLGILGLKYLPGFMIQPGVYAIVAGTATLGGVFRAGVCLVIIIVEGTRGVDFLFGIILAIVCSNLIAHACGYHGVYESELDRDFTIYYLREQPSHVLRFATARDVARQRLVLMSPIVPVDYVVGVLKEKSHHGYPVCSRIRVEAAPNPVAAAAAPADDVGQAGGTPGEPGAVLGGQDGLRLEGLIHRHQLLVLLRSKAFCNREGIMHDLSSKPQDERERELEGEMRRLLQGHPSGRADLADHPDVSEVLSLEFKTESPISPPPIVEATCHLTYIPPLIFEQAGSSGLYLDLRPYMNNAPITVREEATAFRAHQLFTAMDLRHLCVVDRANCIRGIITRKDLDQATGRKKRESQLRQSVASLTRTLSSNFRRSSGGASARSPNREALLRNFGEGGSPETSQRSGQQSSPRLLSRLSSSSIQTIVGSAPGSSPTLLEPLLEIPAGRATARETHLSSSLPTPSHLGAGIQPRQGSPLRRITSGRLGPDARDTDPTSHFSGWSLGARQ